ncbi:MAG TPA: pyridoxamine 5'-phosphate oxidase family protein [Actinomycetota bacterium]|nr:pyridoxamine 5'-phosphate oxidase family protein [Actinomycetota bacterium]
MDDLRTARTTVHRVPARGVYDRAAIDAILDAAPVCHVGVVVDGQPYVMPAIHARVGDELVLHGSSASRLFRHLRSGAPACATATVVDGLVLARSAFHSSMNYRSAVVLGVAREVAQRAPKLAALEAISEHVLPGRWTDVRPPSDAELRATTVVSIRVDEASAKVRTGPPADDDADLELPVWAGVVPLELVAQPPEPDPGRVRDEPVPPYARRPPAAYLGRR